MAQHLTLVMPHMACELLVGHPAGANYRTVWALNKHFPNVKSYVRAHDVSYGLILEKAGATAVVPETLEPSLQVPFARTAFLDVQAILCST